MKRGIKNSVGAIKDAGKATKKFLTENKNTILEVAAVGVGVAAGIGCTIATAGVGAIACMVGAGAVINVAKDAAQGDIHNVGDAFGSMGTGGLSGLGGYIANKIGAAVLSKAGSGIFGRGASEAIENGVGDSLDQAITTGRVDPKSAIINMVPGLSVLKGGGSKAAGGAAPKAAFGNSCPITAKHSFDPGTFVLMADGSRRPIEDVNVGDRVVATDPASGETSGEQVTQLHRNTDREFTDLTVKDQSGRTSTLESTQNHPFWSEDREKWVDAADLEPGDRLKVARHGTATVVRVENFAGTEEMRDLTVANIHTYYVLAGNTPVLVHNCGGTADPGDLIPTHGISGDSSTKRVARYGNDMANGEFDWKQSLIDIVRHEGKMYVVDGHHRLAAARWVGRGKLVFAM